jgi:probable rRNA maturation factor
VKVPPAALFRLSISGKCGKSYVPFLRRHLREARRMLRCPLADLSVALVGDATMSNLHEKYLGESGPTDVLTFELDHDAKGRAIAGEVIVCVPQARRQAVGGKFREEVLLCAVHGMLHLSGMDDRTQRGFAAMHRMEDKLLTRLGVGAVFNLRLPHRLPRRSSGAGR